MASPLNLEGIDSEPKHPENNIAAINTDIIRYMLSLHWLTNKWFINIKLNNIQSGGNT